MNSVLNAVAECKHPQGLMRTKSDKEEGESSFTNFMRTSFVDDKFSQHDDPAIPITPNG